MTTLTCKNPAAGASYLDAVTRNNYFQNHSSLQQVLITKSDSNGIETTKSVQVTSWRSSPPRSLLEKTTYFKKERVREAIKIYYWAPTSPVTSTHNLSGHFVTWFMTKRQTASHLIPRWNQKLVCLKKMFYPAVWNLGWTEWGRRSNLKYCLYNTQLNRTLKHFYAIRYRSVWLGKDSSWGLT